MLAKPKVRVQLTACANGLRGPLGGDGLRKWLLHFLLQLRKSVFKHKSHEKAALVEVEIPHPRGAELRGFPLGETFAFHGLNPWAGPQGG